MGHIDFHQAFAVEEFQHARGRQKRGVVEIESQHLALGRHNADHTVTLTTDADQCPQGIFRGEQFVAHLGAQYGKGARTAQIVGGKETAGGDTHAEGLHEFRAHAVNGDATTAAHALDFRVALDHRAYALHLRHLAQRLGVLQRERAHAAEHADRAAVGLGLAGTDRDQIGAELGEFGKHELVQAFAQCGEQDHRSHPDRNAQCGEQTATGVVGQGAERQAQQVGETHQRLASAWAASSRAALRAGSQANSRAATRAVVTAAAIAQGGGVIGSTG